MLQCASMFFQCVFRTLRISGLEMRSVTEAIKLVFSSCVFDLILCSCPANGYAFTTHLTHCEAMTSIAKDWQDSMSEVDGWAEAIDFIDEDDVKRWNEDKKLDPQKFKRVTIPNLDDVRVTSVTSEMTSDRNFRF